MKNRGKCITCGEPIGMGSFFVVMHKGRARSEHSTCRREKETAARIAAWLRTTPRAGGVLISIASSQDVARLADAIEAGEWCAATPNESEGADGGQRT